MKSMTGYGRGEAEEGGMALVVELSSVNRKNLDIHINGLRDHPALEGRVAARLREMVHRGNLNVQVQRMETSTVRDEDETIKAAATRIQYLDTIAKRAGVELKVDARWIDETLRGILSESVAEPTDRLGDLLGASLERALEAFVRMRVTEGAVMQADLEGRAKAIREAVGRVRSAAAGTVPRYRELLLGRLRDLDLEWDVTDERVLREVLVFADKIDIEEELTRMESHLDQFESALAESGPVGRKLDFIAQEMNREINTIGSKGNDLTVSREVISMKTELERIREQLANVE